MPPGPVDTNMAYTVVSWNIGFGAYEDDYGFFMDGGTESRAWSKERLTANMDAIAGYLKQQNADFCLLRRWISAPPVPTMWTSASRCMPPSSTRAAFSARITTRPIFCIP